jgi:hypothetical protein
MVKVRTDDGNLPSFFGAFGYTEPQDGEGNSRKPEVELHDDDGDVGDGD